MRSYGFIFPAGRPFKLYPGRNAISPSRIELKLVHEGISRMTTAAKDNLAITSGTRARLREAQLNLINSQLWMTAISTPVLTILVSIVLWPLIAHATILIWLGLSLTVLAARMYGYVRFTQIAPTGQAIEFWDRYITGTTTLSS